MGHAPNSLRWDGRPGHYEVYYLSLTDPDSGVGLWIRYTMLAPLEHGEPASCALWLMAMDPAGGDGGTLARKQTHPISALQVSSPPFELTLAGSTLNDHGASGSLQDVSFDLRWQPRLAAYRHVHPLLARAGVAKTELELAHADLEVSGTLTLPSRRLSLHRARGAQAHLWGSKHAQRWAWLHANDLRERDGRRVPDSFIDAVSVYVPRLGRELGPSTPVLARLAGRDFSSISPLRVLRNQSRFGLGGWELAANDADARLQVSVQAPRERLVAVTYTDPDGERAYCYNTEVASLRARLWERPRRGGEYSLRRELIAPGLAHYEYGQRPALAAVELSL